MRAILRVKREALNKVNLTRLRTGSCFLFYVRISQTHRKHLIRHAICRVTDEVSTMSDKKELRREQRNSFFYLLGILFSVSIR